LVATLAVTDPDLGGAANPVRSGGNLENVTPEGLERIQEAARTLRDPATSDR
jgi:hypothetical protein